MYIDPVHQRSGEFRDVAETLCRCAGATVSVAVVSARTRIRSGYKHEVSRVFYLGLETGNGHFSVFHRPSESLHDPLWHFTELVSEKDSVVGKRDFSGQDVVAAASNQSCYGGTVVWSAEWPHPHEPSKRIAFACHRIYLACLQRLLKRHRRQNSGHSLGQRTLAASRAADENRVVSARGRNLKSSLRCFLSDDFRKVHH